MAALRPGRSVAGPASGGISTNPKPPTPRLSPMLQGAALRVEVRAPLSDVEASEYRAGPCPFTFFRLPLERFVRAAFTSTMPTSYICPGGKPLQPQSSRRAATMLVRHFGTICLPPPHEGRSAEHQPSQPSIAPRATASSVARSAPSRARTDIPV